MYGGGAFLIIGMLFLFFLTETVGLPPWSGALIFGIGKVWDAVSDPLMGRISDRTRTRMGRRRFWILIAIPLVYLSFFLLWTALPNSSATIQVAYYTAAYVFFSTVFTMVMVPYSALNADMTRDYRERSRLSGARMAFSMISALLAGTLPKIIINASGGGPRGYGFMGALFGAFYAIILIPVVFGTRELPTEDETDTGGGLKDLMAGFAGLVRNRSFRLHMGLYICAYTAMDVVMLLFAYYLSYVLVRPGMYSAAMGTMMGCEIISLLLWVHLANRRGKGRSYALGVSIWVLGLLMTLLLNSSSSLPAILAVCALLGVGLSAGVFVPWAVLPSVTDVGELIDGKRRAGLYAGAMTLARKLTQGAIAVPLVGVALSLLGFGEGSSAGSANTDGLRILLVFGTVPILILGIFFAGRFPVTPYSHGILRGELDRRRTKKQMTPESEDVVKSVCEDLSGLEWETLGG
jgi:oligogalacturonide transporter